MTNPGMVEKFSRITMIEPNENELVRILEDTLPLIEHNTSSMICYEAIKETLKAADRYIMNVPEPERSISLLEGAATKAASVRGKTIVLPKDISDYVSEKYNVPTGEVEEKEKGKLISLEKIMHQNVIGQNEAISAIANAMRRARAGITESKKPIGSFLFLGPTGVGKTETAKALAEAYFGYKDKMIRFDMSEYKNQEDIYRLIGSNLGDEEFPGALTTAVRENPFSLLLFDEVEKANKEILDLFLQMLDEGFITDGSGRKVSMTNTIIIATSNAGANLVRESIKNGIQYDKVKENLLDNIQKEGIFRPEFLNRFTGVIAFSPLSPSEILSVAKLMISRLAASIQQNKNISLSFAPNVIERLAQLGYNPQMGARPMERIIQEKVENLLANKILTGELKKGDNYTVSLKDIG
jgi:ATP-dependent Clp protease ATP-binding subunit ClpA